MTQHNGSQGLVGAPGAWSGFLTCPKPTAWLRTTELKNVYIRRISTLYANITFKTSQLMADEKALLDSGATENFIDETTWQWLGIGHKELKRPITVTNVDGTENKKGKIMHYCWLCIQKGTHDKLQNSSSRI
jgi:hypothetical protein